MSGIAYYIADLECTGLDITKHECVEISIIRCSDLKQITRYIKCETPETASWKALEVTNLTMKQIQARGESKESAVKAVHSFIEEDGLTPENRCIIGFCVSYDKRFSHRLWEKCNMTFPCNLFLDIKPMAVTWSNKLGIPKTSYTLENCFKILGLKQPPGELHTAKTDTRLTYILWRKALEAGMESLPLIKREPHTPTLVKTSTNAELIEDDSQFIF